MSSLRLGLCALAVTLAVLVLDGIVGHSQSVSSDWFPANITAIDRGMAPLPVSAHRSGPHGVWATRDGDRIGRNGTPYRTGRVLVKFRDGMSSTARVNALSQVSRSATLGTTPVAADFDVVNIDPSADAEAIAQAFAARTDVEYAQPAYRVHTLAVPTFTPNDTYYSQYQWNFPLIGLPQAWAIQQGGSASITVAVVDTGMAFQSGTLTHHAYGFCSVNASFANCPASSKYPDLGTLTLPFARADDLSTDGSRFVSPYDFIWNTTVPVDTDGHGTHVTGTLGELTNNNYYLAGIAFNVKLMPVKVIDTEWDDI
ncbi:MAG TPA: S8 family serine peptidase, partial [Vicinamibacterales bacterium]|nr:S8 family serine peptidase [Vicinamibacterales bacterium]